MNRSTNIQVFRDTLHACDAHPALRGAISSSISSQQVIPAAQALEALPQGSRPGRIILSSKRSFEAARAYPDQRVCVLNFASAINPGGGAASGSSAQEESLCRCSTLYPCLDAGAAWDGFYLPHRQEMNPLHNNDCIYTPGVVVFKSDEDIPRTLPQDQWQRVNIITCAAPNLQALWELDGEISDADLSALHEDRMRRILHIAARYANDVVILGAFGCGAFRNDPRIVAPALDRAVQAWRQHFDVIEFPVFCRAGNDTNHRAFSESIHP